MIIIIINVVTLSLAKEGCVSTFLDLYYSKTVKTIQDMLLMS